MMLPALVMYLWSPAQASEAHNDLGSCRCCLTLLPETTKFLCVLPASVGHRDLPHYLLSLSCSLIRMESFSVDKYLRVPLNQLFLNDRRSCSTVIFSSYFSTISDLKLLLVFQLPIFYETILFSPSGILHMMI